jgi:hypothetical protein
MDRKLPFVLLLAAIGLFIIGLNAGEAEAVFEKAVTVCLSCIGLG